MIPSVSTYSPWHHRNYLEEKEDPRRAHRIYEGGEKITHLCELSASCCHQQSLCTREQSKVRSWTRSERKAEPFDPFTKVVREGDDGVEATMWDGIVRLSRLLSILEFLGLSLGDRLATDIE